MIRAAVIAVAGVLFWASAASAAEVMVVGRDAVLFGPRDVPAAPRTIDVGPRRCAVGPRTPLSMLVGTRLSLDARDEGRCGRSARAAGAIYVEAVAGERERGRGGWVYKVGRRLGTSGAGDPSGPFGTGRLLGSGDRLVWFWCAVAGNCRRTLEVRPSAHVIARGTTVRVTVRGYDDQGRGVRVAGAGVRLGGTSATTNRRGVATLRTPEIGGRYVLRARHAGMVPSFPDVVRAV